MAGPPQAISSPPVQEATPREETTFQWSRVFTVASGHFVHDSFSAFVAPLLPPIQERLATGVAATGSLSIFIQIPSLLQPLIGYAADRMDLRWFIILAPAVTATLCSALGLGTSYWLLAMLLLAAGMSVASFHAPAPAMIARLSGDRVGRGMSIFMAAGELGRTVGPVLVASAVAWWGLEGIWRLALLGWLWSLFLWWQLRHVPLHAPARPMHLREMWPRVRRIYPVLLGLLVARSFMGVAITTLLPLYMTHVHQADLQWASLSLTVLEAAGVLGALAMGTLSDRLGRRRVLAGLLLGGPLCFFLFLGAPREWLLPLLLPLGFLAISPTPVFLALVQDYFPQERALANGLFLTGNFLARSLAVAVVGLLADAFGLPQAFLWSGAAALLAVLGLKWLPEQA